MIFLFKDCLPESMEKQSLSARAYDRILKVSRTIADLDGKKEIMVEHLAEAINYRSMYFYFIKSSILIKIAQYLSKSILSQCNLPV